MGKDKGLRHNSDFSEDEKKAIIEECCVNMIGPTELSKKYNTLHTVISCFVRDAGLHVTPDDLSKHADFPKKSDDMSQEEYQKIIKKYWKNNKDKKRACLFMSLRERRRKRRAEHNKEKREFEK